MKDLYVLIKLLKLFCVGMIIVSFFSSFSQDNKQVIIKEGIGTDLFFIGETKKCILKKHGKTNECEGWAGKVIRNEEVGIVKDTRRKEKKQWKNFYCYDSLGVQILFKNGKVNSISYRSQWYKTSKGISVGASREEMLKQYGGDHDSQRVVYYSLGTAFLFEKDKIVEIQIFKPQI